MTNIGTPLKIENAIAKPGHSAEQVASLRRQFGIGEPPVERYQDWVTGFVKGDWGKNQDEQDQATDLGADPGHRPPAHRGFDHLGAAGCAGGHHRAIRQYTAFDYSMTFLAFLFFSIPAAVLAGFLKEFGAIKLNPWLREPSVSTPMAHRLAVFGLIAGSS
ncbi:MAG: hypothetical protein IPP16_19525 [Acidimicrobiaceae bacterium]|nr:hypothetical protein [Acidimicrobiaceae bacterium]